MNFSTIWILFFVLTCLTRYGSGHRQNSYEYFYPEDDYIETVQESGGNGLADYWKVFKETFQKSYKDLNKPYVIEREVPVYIPVDRVRTVVKHHPVPIKHDTHPVTYIIYRRKPHYRRY